MQPRQIEIGHSEAEHVTIEVLGVEPDDWRITNVEVACGIWKGTFRWQFHKGELRRFAPEVERLYRTLSGAAKLAQMEPNLVLEMVGDGTGHITVEGRAEPELRGTYLVFRLALDQTEVPRIIAALVAADAE